MTVFIDFEACTGAKRTSPWARRVTTQMHPLGKVGKGGVIIMQCRVGAIACVFIMFPAGLLPIRGHGPRCTKFRGSWMVNLREDLGRVVGVVGGEVDPPMKNDGSKVHQKLSWICN